MSTAAVTAQVQKVADAIPENVKEKLHKHQFPLLFFVVIQVIYICINFLEFTVVTVLGRLVQFQLFAFILYQIVSRIMQNTTYFKFPYGFKADKNLLEPVSGYVEYLSQKLEEYMFVKKPIKSLKFIVVLQVVCVLGKIFNGLTLTYLTINAFILTPIIYEYQQQNIDTILSLVQSKIDQVIAIISSKIPPQLQVTLSNFKKTISSEE